MCSGILARGEVVVRGREPWKGERRVREEEREATRPELASEVSTQDEIRTTGSAVPPQSTYPRRRAKATHQIYQEGLWFFASPLHQQLAVVERRPMVEAE